MRKILVFTVLFLVTFGITVGIGVFTRSQLPKDESYTNNGGNTNPSVAFYHFPPMVISVPPVENIIFDDPITIIGRP